MTVSYTHLDVYKRQSILGPLAYFLRAGQALFTTKDYTYRIKTENDDFI